MSIHRVVADIHLATGKPAIKWRVGTVQNGIRLLVPGDGFSSFAPELLGIFFGLLVEMLIVRHGVSVPEIFY